MLHFLLFDLELNLQFMYRVPVLGYNVLMTSQFSPFVV
jgi:hypothetical protein